MVIMQDAPPKLKRFLKPLGRKATVRALLIRCIVAFLLHRGRMGAARAAGAVRSEPRHRAQIARFLGRKMLRRLCRKVKPRTYYVHTRRQTVHSVGEVQLVFSTSKKPNQHQRIEIQKILMTNDLSLTGRQIVELYALRWQIELYFKELKSTLGFHQYRFRSFVKVRSEEHTSELQSQFHLVCRLLL